MMAVDPKSLRAATDASRALERADRVVAGEFQAYRWNWRRMPQSPAEWLKRPGSGSTSEAGTPWWRISHLDPAGGDIKDVWEPARFGWVYDLVRAYLLSGDDRYAASFYDYLSSWAESSPPFQGVHWSCGQETSIRAAALLYAEANLADAPSSTDAAKQKLLELLAASGERVRDAIGYAISQRNNHAISEATGLILLAHRLSGQHPEAAEWFRTGHRLLERLIREQFAADGWYIQHSFTYLRLALDQCVLAERALRERGGGLSATATGRLRAATELLWAVIEPSTGIVPNHGANDGAFVHPITLSEYRDFRPVLTAVCATWNFPFPAGVAPDMEVLAWLGLDPPPTGPSLRDGVRTGSSGWAAVRLAWTSVFFRAGSYDSRPGHLDPLHLDVRLGGREIVVDPGTFAYNAPPPWRNGLATAMVHNGPVVDGQEPGVRGPRFLWYLWPEARLLKAEANEDGYQLVGEIPGVVRRTVRVGQDEIRVEDTVLRPEAREAAVRWLLHPDADPAHLSAPGAAVEGAIEDGVESWFSPGYGVRVPSRSVYVAWDPRIQPTSITTIRAAGLRSARSDEPRDNNHTKSISI